MCMKAKMYSIFLVSFFFIFSPINANVQRHIDVVIPCHEKDALTLELSINGVKKNCKNIRRIIVVSKKKLTNNAEWFDEARYPFNRRSILMTIFNNDISKVAQYETAPRNRTGWIYQQLLKLYAPLVIPDISSNVLVVDAD